MPAGPTGHRGETGRCGAGRELRASAHLLHYGEEPPISGRCGSGAVFFSHCPLTCAFCQNHQISQDGMGRTIQIPDLADMMLDLETQGAHRHQPGVPHALGDPHRPQPWTWPGPRDSVCRSSTTPGGSTARPPWTCCTAGVDVYLPDVKNRGPRQGADGIRRSRRRIRGKLFGAANYAVVNRAAVQAMFRQVGHLTCDDDGLAVRGMLARHLVLPGRLEDTRRVLAWMADTFGPSVWLSLMAQYKPCYRVTEAPEDFPGLTRPLNEEEYEAALSTALDLDMENVFVQDLESADDYLPDFSSREVFPRTG